MKELPKFDGKDRERAGGCDLSRSKPMRKSEVGDWKKYFTAEQEQCVDRLCQQMYAPLGLAFKHD